MARPPIADEGENLQVWRGGNCEYID